MEENQSFLDLQVDQASSKNLLEAARWARFLSIIGFVCMGLLLIFFIAFQNQIANAFAQFIPGVSNSAGFGILLAALVITAALVVLLMFFLIRAATLIRRGIETKNQEVFNNGLASLKAYFTMYGILSILGLITTLLNLNR